MIPSISFYGAILCTICTLVAHKANPQGIAAYYSPVNPQSVVMKIPAFGRIIHSITLAIPQEAKPIVRLADAFGEIDTISREQTDYLLNNTYPDRWKNDNKQIHCLARNAYFEARGESETGKLAVMLVTMNRVVKRSLTPCGAVYARINKTCEFSWTCDGVPHSVFNNKQYDKLVQMARLVLAGEVFDRTYGFDFYWNPHTVYSQYHQDLMQRGWCAIDVYNHRFLRKPLYQEKVIAYREDGRTVKACAGFS